MRDSRSTPALVGCRTIGNALVVHAVDRLTDEARDFAMAVAEDPEHDLVVVDLPADVPALAWQEVASAIPRRRRGLRLVIGGRDRETVVLAGHWLAERLGRPVLAPDGPLRQAAGGCLFVDSGGGWIRFQQGRGPRPEARRFPRPHWDGAAVDEVWPTSATGVAEPIPGGVWIRPALDEPDQQVHRARLTEVLAYQPGVLAVVLGWPGMAPISLDDVARFWMRLSAPVRQMVRFVEYGPVSRAADVALGQAIADLLSVPVVCYAGLPVAGQSAGTGPDVYTVLLDGAPGWHSLVRELGYRPSPEGAGPAPPAVLSHRVPVYFMPELAPGIYWYAPDAVLEVVQSGLWLRPPDAPDHAADVRATRADPTGLVLLIDAADEASDGRMRHLAEDALARLDPGTRQVTRVVSAAELGAAPPAAGEAAVGEVSASGASADLSGPASPTAALTAQPASAVAPVASVLVGIRLESGPGPGPGKPIGAGAPRPAAFRPTATLAAPPAVTETRAATEPETDRPVRFVAFDSVVERRRPAGAVAGPEPPVGPDSPARAEGSARPQPIPAAEASALLPRQGIDQERSWLRRTLSQQYDATAHAVARVISEHPGTLGESGKATDDALIDLVAVRLYLSAVGDGLDDALRTATVGAHIPFARCVVSGLRRLPSYRGAAMFTTTATTAQLRAYQDRPLLTEWGFISALTAPCAGQQGNLDVLIWSMTASRTRLLEPEPAMVEDRVLFVPGTSFKKLDFRPPASGGARGRIVLRELAAAEIDDNGRVDAARIPLDQSAINTLRQAAERWATQKPRLRVTPAAAARFAGVPGLLKEDR